jgi:hypothetical protein
MPNRLALAVVCVVAVHHEAAPKGGQRIALVAKTKKGDAMEEKTKNAFDGLRAGLRKLHEKLQTRAKNLRGIHLASPTKALTRADIAQILEETAHDIAELSQALDEGLKKPVGTWGRQ